MIQNVFQSEQMINGAILHNLEIKGLDTDKLVETLVQFLSKEQIDFVVLEIKKEEPKANNYLESSELRQSNMNIEENKNIEQIYAVIECLNLDKETRMLIQQQINLEDSVQDSREDDHNSKNDLIAGLLRTQVEQISSPESPNKGWKRRH